MVEPVADYLNGRGHPVRRVRDIGLASADDIDVAAYASAHDLVVVTFDRHFRNSLIRRNCRCLHIEGVERTARNRLAEHYRSIVDLFYDGRREVVLPRNGPAIEPVRRPRRRPAG
jgi:predicted nuclease of predicted toxin-antitoxin system